MSTTAPDAVPHGVLDISSTSQVSMATLARVEFRKALDTRAGRWFVIAILGLVVVIEVIYSFAADDTDKNLQDYIQIPAFTLGYFLPIIIIMLVTSEQSQRNGLVTFTLEPRRPRIVLAKFIAGLALAVVGDGPVLRARAGRDPAGRRDRRQPDLVRRRQPDLQRVRPVQPDRGARSGSRSRC